MAVLGCSGERGEEQGGSEGRGRRMDQEGEQGRVGEGNEEAGAWRPYPLLDAGEGVRWQRALFRPGSGEQGKGTLCGGWAGQSGCGPGGLGGGRAGGLGCLVQGASPPPFSFFCKFFLLSVFPFCFI